MNFHSSFAIVYLTGIGSIWRDDRSHSNYVGYLSCIFCFYQYFLTWIIYIFLQKNKALHLILCEGVYAYATFF